MNVLQCPTYQVSHCKKYQDVSNMYPALKWTNQYSQFLKNFNRQVRDNQWKYSPFRSESIKGPSATSHRSHFVQFFNRVRHGIRKQEKCSSLEQPRGNFYKIWWARQGVKITQFISIFPSKRVWKFKKKSADKIWSNKDKRVKMPCPVPARLKVFWWWEIYVFESFFQLHKSSIHPANSTTFIVTVNWVSSSCIS